MSKNLQVDNAGLAREVDMFDKKKGILETVGKVKKRADSNSTTGTEDNSKTKGKKKDHDKNHKKSVNQDKVENADGKNHNNHEDDHQARHVDFESGDEHNDNDGAKANIPDDDSHFRFHEVVDPEEAARKSRNNSLAGENKVLLENVRNVEDRLKSREQICLTMMSIELGNLPSAHRFTKNSPWLKGAYGTLYSWVGEYEETDDGTKAAWKNLRWSFNLERNLKDRNDLVITVCSKNLIIGRYVLGKDEFADIPDTKTGYFEVSGDIMSGIGQAGKVRILFLKGKAERPRGPMKAVAAVPVGGSIPHPVNELKLAVVNSRRLYVKVVSAAVMDLKSVHFLDVNCPFIAVEVGDWVGVSDTAHNAGMAARWNSLNWKFTVTPEVGIHLMIHSKNVMIGRMHVSMEEITNIQPKVNNIIEVIKSITDGKDVTGKVKVNILAESPQASELAAADPGGLLNGSVQELDEDGNVMESGPDHSAKSVGAAAFHGSGDLAPMKPFMRVPFNICVSEVTVLDTIKAHFLWKNSLAVNVVCGPWGKATDELKGSGSFAHWIDLKWKIPVKGGNNFRITAWSHGKSIGSASVTVAELLEMPTDYEQNTEIFAKLTNPAGEIVGKVKLTCKYESLVTMVNDKIVAVAASPEKPKGKEFLPNVGTERVRAVSFIEDETLDFFDGDGDMEGGKSVVAHRRQELTLPLVATIKSMSIYDAVAVHTFKKNSPQIKFICDRKSATTEAVKNAGAVATWPGLNWIMKIRADSHVVAVLMSGEVTIGRVEFQPKDLLHIPLNDEGLTEIKTLLKKDNSTTAKLLLLVDLKSLEDLPPPEPNSFPGAVPSRGSVSAANAAYYQQRNNPGFGNTAGPLDQLSTPSISATLPQLQNSYNNSGFNQYQLQGPRTAPLPQQQLFGAGSQSQRVPTFPSQQRPPLPSTAPNPNMYGNMNMNGSFNLNNGMGGMYAGNMNGTMNGTMNGMNNSYNVYSPPPRHNGALFHSPEAADLDQRSLTWGASMSQYPPLMPSNPQQMIFDRGLMSAENARKLNMSFNIAIQEIDLIDLKPQHKLINNCPFVSAACGKWTASTEPIMNAGDTAFWTKLNWKSSCKTGGNLRLIVNSKTIIMGSANFSTDDLLNALSDDKGLRRVSGNIINEAGVHNGRIKVAYTMDVMTGNNNVSSPTSSPQQAGNPYGAYGGNASVAGGQSVRGGASVGAYGGGAQGYFPGSSPPAGAYGGFGTSPPQSQRVPYVVTPAAPQQYPFDMGDDSYYDELIDPDPRKHVEFPFNIHILEMSTLDLVHVHQFKRNQPVIKAFCDTFYSETKVSAEYADVTYFRELNWIFPVKEKSIFKVTVSSRDKDIGSVVVDLNQLKSIPFDQQGLREMVLSFEDSRGRSSGKVRMIVKLSNAATNDYDQSHSIDAGELGMDGVSVDGSRVPNQYANQSYTNASVKRGGPGGTGGTVGGGAGASIAGAGGISGQISVAGSVPGVSYGKDFEYLLQSQVEAVNELANVAVLQMTLSGIAVIDLRAVHTFAPNSPSVNLACGKVVATTPPAENAGKMANWEDLNIGMPLDKSSMLRVLISSKDKVIGQCTLSRPKLLGGRKNQKGFFVLFGELDNNGKNAGKIKFVYTLEDRSNS